jgi:hypothetical protein
MCQESGLKRGTKELFGEMNMVYVVRDVDYTGVHICQDLWNYNAKNNTFRFVSHLSIKIAFKNNSIHRWHTSYQ